MNDTERNDQRKAVEYELGSLWPIIGVGCAVIAVAVIYYLLR
jgi:hypothetical protein